jgi:serine/threonine-protein kinase
MIGDRLGKWVIYKELGRGGMGRVYLAREELSGQHAAVKVLAAELAQDEGFLHRFQREIETLSQLDHPGIVRFYEAGCEGLLYYYAMEYVAGQSLEEVLLDQHRLPWKEVLDIALQICPALKHVHDHGIIHRDLKPPNILLTTDGQVKLTDFGIAKVFASSHLTATGGVVGTAEFLSPEQAAGKPVSKRSDLYSLGVVLYTLLTGRTPFEGSNFLDLLHKHRYGQFDPPAKVTEDVPYELDEVVCKLLEKDPADRPSDCLVLGRQLESLRRKLERKGIATELGRGHDTTAAENKTGSAAGKGPGPATLMSKLMREELKRQKEGGPLHQALNKVWVLVPLLLLCVGVLVWSFWPASPESLYERGSELMKSDSLADKERAWRDFLEPLEKDHPGHAFKKEVAELRQQLEAARTQRDDRLAAKELFAQGDQLMKAASLEEKERAWRDYLEPLERKYPSHAFKKQVANLRQQLADARARHAPPPAAPAVSEAQRFYRLGEWLLLEGKPEEARRMWTDAKTLFGAVASEQEWVRLATKGLAELNDPAVAKARLAPVWAALKEAARLRDQGKQAEAERIWTTIEKRYAADPAAQEIVRAARAARLK